MAKENNTPEAPVPVPETPAAEPAQAPETPAAEAPKKQLPDSYFELEGKTYEVVLHAVIIPEIGLRTAAEIVFDEAAQKYLVEARSSAVREVIL